jgi:fumarate reductase flavoprotein subunit
MQPTDVLVVGSGLTGLIAAIHCRKQGADVAVCSKSRPGLSNCSAVSQGIFRASTESFHPAEHKRLTLQAGGGLNREGMLDVLAANAARDVRELEDFGVRLQERPTGFDAVSGKVGTRGLSVTKPVAEYARSAGVRFVSPFFAWRLAVADGRAAGVWGCEPGGEPALLPARSVILATGGAGALYARTDNPQGMTGDGLALAFEVGVPLTDMEFVQFYPLCMASGARTSRILPPLIAEAGRLENVRGEDVVSRYSIRAAPIALAGRDQLCQAMAREAGAGLAFPDGSLRFRVFRDDASWNRAGETFGLESVQGPRAWTEKLLDADGTIPVMPAAHFCMGGVAAGEDCSTPVSGLFAAGEVVGGLHGANRYGGNALSETVVFGRIAAQQAVRAAGDLGEPDWRALAEPERSAREARGAGQGNCADLRRALQEIMWRGAGVLRSEQGLQDALRELSGIRGALPGNPPGSSPFVREMELQNMLSVAEAIVRAALARRESRGSHYRSDYPGTDEAQARHILLRKEGEGAGLQWVE